MPVEMVVVDVALYVTEIVDMTTEILTWLVDLLVAIWNHVPWWLAGVVDEVAPRTPWRYWPPPWRRSVNLLL
jgi:hypothetical protein